MDRFLCGYNHTFRIPPTSGSSVYNLLQAGVIDNAGAAEKPTPHTRQQKKQRIRVRYKIQRHDTNAIAVLHVDTLNSACIQSSEA